MAAPRALSASASPGTTQAALSLLRDPIRVVRTETARALRLACPRRRCRRNSAVLSPRAYDELVAAEMTDAERPEAHLNLGLLHTRLAQPTEADAEYRTALRLDPDFVPALRTLPTLIGCVALTRRVKNCCAKRWRSIREMQMSFMRWVCFWCVSTNTPMRCRCSSGGELAPDTVRYAYVYAIALNRTGHRSSRAPC